MKINAMIHVKFVKDDPTGSVDFVKIDVIGSATFLKIVMTDSIRNRSERGANTWRGRIECELE